MKKIFVTLMTMLSLGATAQDNSIRDGGEYFIYNTYYNRCLGTNEAKNGPALSPFATNDSIDYVWVAEASTLHSGYYWLRKKSTSQYLQASNDPKNTWGVWLAGSLNKEYNSYEWKPTGGTESKIISNRGEQINAEGNVYLGTDPGKEESTFVNVYYDKPFNDRSTWQIVDANYPLAVSRLKLYTDELDEAISAGESVYDNPIYGEKGQKEELAIALYNARTARELASLDDTEAMTKANKALVTATENAREGHYTIWISGSSFGTNTTFTIAFKGLEFKEEMKDYEVTALVRNKNKTGAMFNIGNGYISMGDKKIEAGAEGAIDWQLAFDGTNVNVYGNGTLLGTLPQGAVASTTSVAQGAEWTMFGLEALKTCTPEIVSYNYAFAPGEFYQENGKSKSTALKIGGNKIDLDIPIDYHILADNNTVSTGSIINLVDPDAWVVFDNVRPSDVISKYLRYVKINGKTASNGSNCRVAIYLQGAVVYPWKSTETALWGYSGQMLSGNEYKFQIGKNSDMGDAANNIQSFILKRGYMVCFSTNSDGSGYSRVYVADHKDKVVESLPAELSGRISRAYIRKWNWVSKKGWSSTEATNAINAEGKLVGATWFYTWGADRSSQTDMEYIPVKQHRYWPSYSALDKQDATACLGLNEPDHSEQHDNCDCGGRISEWTATTMMPDFLDCGLRIGSPAPTDEGWLKNFIGHVNDMAYRCDFVAFHSYWGTNEAKNSDAWWSRLNSIYQATKRPIWLTEWNNGASWTTESWPSSYSDQLTYQMNKMKEILSVLDNADFIERYCVYNWDGGMPRYLLKWDGNKNANWVTPCGEVYRDTHPTHAYQEKMQYIPHYWWPSVKKEGNTISSFEIKTVGRKMNITTANANGDITADETLEYKDSETGEWRTFLTNAFPRKHLDTKSDRTSTIALDNCDINALTTDNLTLRVKITTVKGDVVYSNEHTDKIPPYIKNHYTESVGVPTLLSDEDKEEIFDLSGRKLNAVPENGIYIRNGIKVRGK